LRHERALPAARPLRPAARGTVPRGPPVQPGRGGDQRDDLARTPGTGGEVPMNGSPDAVLRLRPVVRASRLPDGIHLRSWSTSVSLEGAAGLWPLWERLHPLLASGVTEAALETLCPGTRRAAGVLLDQLREHDLLVRVSPATPAPPAVRSWLESAAPDPDAAWAALHDLRITVDGEGPLATAALTALTRCALTVHQAADALPNPAALPAAGSFRNPATHPAADALPNHALASY